LDHGIFADPGRTGDDDQQWFWSIQVEFYAFRHTGLFFMVAIDRPAVELLDNRKQTTFYILVDLDYNLEVGCGGIMVA
jgi:hypothetical protein